MVISGVNTVTYNGDGSQTAWPFTFPIASASEIKVQLINADGTTTAVENDYYVDVVNNTVYYPGYAPGAEPPEADQPPKVQTGQKIEIYREVPMTQEANLGDAWPYYIIEKGLDKLTMICQQIYSYTNRKLDSALASMFQLAGIVTDSGKLQHITDQYNAIDANAAAAAESEENAAASEANALSYKNAAATSATNAANSASSASTTATQLMAYLADKEEITAPAVDPTLTISGAAADAKVTGDDLNLVLNKTEVTYIPVGGSHAGTEITFAVGYIDTSGVYHGSGGYSCTDYIELKLSPVIDSHISGLTTVLAYSFYDEDKTFISGIHAGSHWGNISGIQTIPATAKYVRICLMNANVAGYVNFSDMERTSTVEDAVLKSQIETEIDDIEELLVSSEKVMVSDISGEGVQNGIVDNTGTFQSTAAWVVTGYIPCKYLSEVTEHVHAFTTVPYAVYYDKYKVFIGSETAGSESVQTRTLTIPTDAFYVRLNMFKADTTQYYVCVTNEKEKSAFNTINKFDLLYGKKLGAAGDSITIGTYSVPGMTFINQIANAHNMTVDNQGIWGSVFPTGKTEGGNPRGSIYSQIANLSNDCDAVILSGGINDADYWNDDEYWGTISGGYNATLDTTTFCGAFEATLRDALAKWKGKPILFVFEHRMTTTYQSAYGQHFENVQFPLMIEMLEKWGVPYVDLFHDMPSIKLTSGYIALYSFDDQGVHPNVAGYRKFYVPRVESKLISLSV